MPVYRREFQPIGADTAQRLNQSDRDDVASSVASMGLTTVRSGDVILQPRTNGNGIYLSAGTMPHSGLTITTPNFLVMAAPGAYTNYLWDVQAAVVRIRGMAFQVGADQTRLVRVGGGAIVIFDECLFYKADPSPTTAFVEIVAGGKAAFNGCIFAPAKSVAGFVVDNAGVIGDVIIQGGVNTTGQVHNNVTILSELV